MFQNKPLNAIWIRTCGLLSLLEQAQQTSPSVAELRLAPHYAQLHNKKQQ